MVDFILNLRPHFTDADKEACKPVIDRIVELSQLARKEGLLALEDELKEEDSIFLKTAIVLIVDAMEPDTIKEYLQRLILADDYSGSELLSRLIMAEGALMIQHGDNPRRIQEGLATMLGEKYLLQVKEAQKAEDEAKIIKNPEQIKQFLEEIKGCKGLPECLPLEMLMIRMPDESIVNVLRNVNSRDLAIALKGCGYEMIRKIFYNISESMCVSIAADMQYFTCVRIRDVEEAQQRIVEIIDRLEKNGEIALR